MYGARENLYEFRVTNDIFVEEDKVHQETHQPAVSHWQSYSHSCIKYATDGIELVILVMIGTDCIGRCISLTTMITPRLFSIPS